MILINATTLMHKSTLNTNNFRNNDFGQKYQKQNIRRIFRKLQWCMFEKFPSNIEKSRKCIFVQIFHFFWQFRNFKKLIIGILLHQKMPLIFLQQLISWVKGKVFKNYSKIYLESNKFGNQRIKIDVKIILLLFAISSENSKLWKNC